MHTPARKMTKSPFEHVGDFLRKFELPTVDHPGGTPRLLDDETFLFRQQHMLEELIELTDAHRKKDLPAFADALGDLLYLVCGTAHFANVDLNRVFEEIHRANMTKERARDVNNKRGSKIDVVKPPGWQPPNIHQVLADQGWEQ